MDRRRGGAAGEKIAKSMIRLKLSSERQSRCGQAAPNAAILVYSHEKALERVCSEFRTIVCRSRLDIAHGR